MPEETLLDRLRLAALRLRLEGLLWALTAGAAAFAALAFVAAAPLAFLMALLLTAWVGYRSWRRWTLANAAFEIERRAGTLDNLVVTAAEILEHPRPVRAQIREEIARQAASRFAAVDLKVTIPLGRAVAVAIAVTAGAVATTWSASHQALAGGRVSGVQRSAESSAVPSVTLRVRPPEYTGLPDNTIENPVQTAVLAGSHLRLESSDGLLEAESVSPLPFAFTLEGDRSVAEWVARDSISFTLRRRDAPSGEARFVSLLITPDLAPVVRLTQPGKDLALTDPAATLAIEADANDDLGLDSLELRYTRASGTGESLAFNEGTVRLDLTRPDSHQWTGRTRWSLAPLKLEDGDLIVYRAVARDRNPGATPAQSGSFVIEIGRQSSSLSTGFAISTDEKRYAISQQMVIYKTEQLLANLRKGQADWLEQTRSLAVEQRMVRSEIVFLSGGEIEDEEVEAAASDELSEGRLRNTGRAEMLRAITSMSRAETELNGGNAQEALVHERTALQALERAFDRRRYFLRTIADRSRIDQSRRLTGTLSEARSWTQEPNRPSLSRSLEAARSLMSDLVAARPLDTRSAAALAARLSALDSRSAALQEAAVDLATAPTREARVLAIDRAMATLRLVAQASLSSASPVELSTDPMEGRLADRLKVRQPGGPPR